MLMLSADDRQRRMVSGPAFNTDPAAKYSGPDFDEFCIREGRYLPASRDRTPCITCPLGNLCQAGFEEQVRKVVAGEDPSLTACATFSEEALQPGNLLAGLTDEQIAFVRKHVPGL